MKAEKPWTVDQLHALQRQEVLGGTPKLPKQPSPLEETLLQQIELARLPLPEREYRFSDRRYRFDFCWPQFKLAVEVQGGYYSNGRHNRNPISDCKKANYAGLQGWSVLFFKPDEVTNGSALQQIGEALGV